MLLMTVRKRRRFHYASRSRLGPSRTRSERGSGLAARRNTRCDSDGGINGRLVRNGTFKRLPSPQASIWVAHIHVHDLALLVKYDMHFGVRVVVLVDDIACPSVDRFAIQIDKEEIIIIKIEISIDRGEGID